jgi:hypothetical protein
MAFVWITVARGLMAIALGLALALNGDRAPAALVKFMGLYWILNGIEGRLRRRCLLGSGCPVAVIAAAAAGNSERRDGQE